MFTQGISVVSESLVEARLRSSWLLEDGTEDRLRGVVVYCVEDSLTLNTANVVARLPRGRATSHEHLAVVTQVDTDDTKRQSVGLVVTSVFDLVTQNSTGFCTTGVELQLVEIDVVEHSLIVFVDGDDGEEASVTALYGGHVTVTQASLDGDAGENLATLFCFCFQLLASLTGDLVGNTAIDAGTEDVIRLFSGDLDILDWNDGVTDDLTSNRRGAFDWSVGDV